MGSPGMQERLGNDDSEWCECEGELWFAAASLPAPSVGGRGAGLTQLPDLLAPYSSPSHLPVTMARPVSEGAPEKEQGSHMDTG